MKRLFTLAIFALSMFAGYAHAELSPTQFATFKAALLAETDAELVGYRNNGQTSLIAAWYGQSYSPTFYVWKTDVPKLDIFGALNWKNFTPADAPDTSQAYANRALACQSFQFNVQTMLISPGETLDMARLNIRNGIKDSIEAIPAGVGGASLDAGWTNVKAISYRPASRVEKLFVTGTGTTSVPGTLVYEGGVTEAEVNLAVAQ